MQVSRRVVSALRSWWPYEPGELLQEVIQWRASTHGGDGGGGGGDDDDDGGGGDGDDDDR